MCSSTSPNISTSKPNDIVYIHIEHTLLWVLFLNFYIAILCLTPIVGQHVLFVSLFLYIAGEVKADV